MLRSAKLSKNQSDITVLGGGLAGLSFAIQCRQHLPDAKITVLEKREHPVPEAAFKVGESTVEVAAHYFGSVLGLRQHIVDEQLPKLGLRFFFPAGDNSRIEERLELGGKRYAPCPSYQLDRGRFENYLGDLCLERGIQFVDQATIKNVEVNRFGPHVVEYDLNGGSEAIKSRWVVDASGRRAFLKRKLKLQMPSEHVANAAWFRFRNRIKIDDWSNESEWHAGHNGKTARWYSTNHFMGEGYWVWMIPLSSGSTSMGIVAEEKFHSLSSFNSFDKALAWLDKYEPQCAKVVRENTDCLQDFQAIKRYSTECKQVFSANRWGITGEAGFFHDPFYSPGSDFIAFANTFLCDLIRRDMTRRPFRVRAYSYDRIFKRFYYGTLSAYQDQYQVFGNPTVMPVKILWDYLVYWSITGFIFMQGRMCEQSMYLRNLKSLKRLGDVNHFMQDLFQRWHQATADIQATGQVDISQMPIIRQTNQRLIDQMASGEFFKRFATNLAQLEKLAHEIAAESGLGLDVPFAATSDADVVSDAFQQIFDSTHPSRSEQSLVTDA